MNKIMALLAFVTLAAYVAILGIWVPSPDLVAVIALTVVLVGYDFFTSARDDKD